MELGTLRFSTKDFASTLRVDRIAVDPADHTLMAASMSGPRTTVKAFTASLNIASRNLRIEIEDIELTDRHGEAVSARKLARSSDGYDVLRHKLPYKLAQAIVFARTPGLLRCVSPHALWAELRSARFTTPLLMEWLPWLELRLLHEDLLRRFAGCRMNVGVLTAGTEDLDRLVSDGLRKRKIDIS